MPANKKGARQKGFDITGLTDFRPPQLSQNIVLPQPNTPPSHSSTPPLHPVGSSSSSVHNNNNNNKYSNTKTNKALDEHYCSLTSPATASSSQQQQQQPPSLNLHEDVVVPEYNSTNNASASAASGNKSSNNNSNNSLWNQLAEPTGGILFHHTTDKEQYLRSKTSSSSNKHKKAVESDRLLYVLNAYQFVIQPDSLVPRVHPDILKAMLSFDEFPPWSHICAVVQNGEFEEFVCPICLDTPLAPRMTHCGHVFCACCWNAHATERGNVAMKLAGKEKFATHHPHLDEIHGSASIGMCTNALDVTCPVCSKSCRASATKPLLFVPSSHQKLESNKKPIEFTRLQRLRRAPVFFLPKAEHDGVVISSSTTNNNNTNIELTRSTSFDATPLTTVTTKNHDYYHHNSSSSNAAAAGGHFPRSSSSSSNFTTTSATTDHSPQQLLDIIPPLCVDNADDATLCSRYVAFNAKVLIDWAEGQMISLSEQKIEAEGNLAAVVTSAGPDTATTEKANPMVLALKSQLAALDCAIRQLSREVDIAQKAPSPMPREFSFPAGLIDQTSSPENVVDLYRRSGTGLQLFLHPMSTRMIQENAIANEEKLPATISCCIEDVESITQNVELRHHKSFSHIPLGASYQVAFADLRSKLSPQVAKKFDHSVEDRKEKIKRMLQREARIERKAEEYMNYVNQVRAQREQQLLMEFGYQSDHNSTSMLNDDEIAKRNAEAFAVALEDSYNQQQQAEEAGKARNNKKKSSNTSKFSYQQQQQPHPSTWRDNLPSLGDLPSDPNDDDYHNPEEGYNYQQHNFTTTTSTTATNSSVNQQNTNSNNNKKVSSSSSSASSSNVVFVKLGSGNSNNTNSNTSTSSTAAAAPSLSAWGSNNNNSNNNNQNSNAPVAGKPLSFSEMMKKGKK